MNPLKSPFADYFEHLAVSFAEDAAAIEIISKAAALTGEKAREALLNMDYHCELNLDFNKFEDSKTIVLEQGYHYFVTGLDVMQMVGNPHVPFYAQFRDNANEVDFSGSPLILGQPSIDRGLIEVDAGFSSYDTRILQESRQYFRYVGDRGILQVRAKQNSLDVKKISVLISGWKICLSEV